jgi:hypothetical protein
MRQIQWSPELIAQTRASFEQHASAPDVLVPLKHIDGRFGVAGFSGSSGPRIDVWDRASGTLRCYDSLDALINEGWAID